jgi:hypothetical protein
LGFEGLRDEIQNFRADMHSGFDHMDALLDELLERVDNHLAAIRGQLDAAAARQQLTVRLLQRLRDCECQQFEN